MPKVISKKLRKEIVRLIDEEKLTKKRGSEEARHFAANKIERAFRYLSLLLRLNTELTKSNKWRRLFSSWKKNSF